MLTLFGDLDSGNVHKVQMILRKAGAPYRRVDTSSSRGDTRTEEFRAISPIGKVPVILFDNGDVLAESGAILYYFGRSMELWPGELWDQSQVLRWMFFEQYSHEPSVAVIRSLKHRKIDAASAAEIEALTPKARHALGIMESRLDTHDWLAFRTCTIADYALYPYTRCMDESGIDPADFPAIGNWLDRIEALPGFLVMGKDGAEEAMTFSDYQSAGR